MSKISTVLLALFILATSGLAASPSKILEKKFVFPFPVQWRVGYWEVSVAGVAWGPANSPEMISKGHEEPATDKPFSLPDRPYALAIKLRGVSPNPVWDTSAGSSGLLLIKDISGDYQVPLELTPAGFVHYSGRPAVYDLAFNRTKITEFWDFFPVSPRQKRFLFQSFVLNTFQYNRGRPMASFRVLIRNNGLELVNLTSPSQNACTSFTRKFSGTIGSGIAVKLQLTVKGKELSGTEQYAKVGKTLWLTGHVDSFGNFILHEQYPKGHVTGIFKGRFTVSCHLVTGYFSKPDGSELLPFRFDEDRPAK